jgi:hypothetical protein
MKKPLVTVGIALCLVGSGVSLAPATVPTIAPCNGNGSLSPWQLTSAMVFQRGYDAAVQTGGRIYALGGNCLCGPPVIDGDTGKLVPSNVWLNTVEFASVNPDGSLGPWQQTSSMIKPRFSHRAVAVGNYIYAIGGGPSLDSSTTAERALVNPDGTLGPWQLVTPPNQPRYQFSAVAAGGYLYVIGGSAPFGGVLSSVEKAAIHSDGSLGPWQPTTPLTFARTRQTSVAAGSYVYVIGGDNVGFNQHRVERAFVNTDGSLGPWQTLNPTVFGRVSAASTVQDGFVYALGGAPGPFPFPSSTFTAERAKINSDGTLGVWQTSGILVMNRIDHAAVAVNGNVYAVGGLFFNGEHTVPTAAVERAGVIGCGVVCLKDQANNNILQFNPSTGSYTFTVCKTGFTLSGTGTLRVVNSILLLTDSQPDRRVSAGFLEGQATGKATIILRVATGVWQTFSINDIGSFGGGCLCGTN